MRSHRLLPGPHSSFSGAAVPGLQLQHGAQELLRALREEADLGVGVEAVQVGRLWRQGIVYVLHRESQEQVIGTVWGASPAQLQCRNHPPRQVSPGWPSSACGWNTGEVMEEGEYECLQNCFYSCWENSVIAGVWLGSVSQAGPSLAIIFCAFQHQHPEISCGN